MKSFFSTVLQAFKNRSTRNKILITLGLLAVYRFLVYIPVPFADITQIQSLQSDPSGGVGFFLLLLGGTIDQFSILAVGLAPYINASIIMQLMGSVIPQLEELQEQGEAGSIKLQQYTRYLAFPLAFLQSFGMVYFINFYLKGSSAINVIDVSSLSTVIGAAFVLSVGSMLLLWIGELITEKGISNGVSLIIFASIVAGISNSVASSLSSATNTLGVIVFMLVLVLVLILLSILILKSVKNIPVVYAKQGKVQQTSSLPIPMNPVGMVPIIFAMAFVSFPYLVSQIIVKMGWGGATVNTIAVWIEQNMNINQNSLNYGVRLYFLLIVLFTFFYTIIVFNPERMADTIQKKGGFIPGTRPGNDTTNYINKILMHLCLWGGLGLAFVGIYSYIINDIPFIKSLIKEFGTLPLVVTGSGIIIIVGVVQDILNKIKSDLLMQKYDRM